MTLTAPCAHPLRNYLEKPVPFKGLSEMRFHMIFSRVASRF